VALGSSPEPVGLFALAAAAFAALLSATVRRWSFDTRFTLSGMIGAFGAFGADGLDTHMVNLLV
jgi:hypothetical protein